MTTLGEMLVEARKKEGYSSLEVSHATRIMLPAIQALEDDQLSSLPAAGYVRGYLLSYCKLLGIDPQPYLDQYERQSGHARRDSIGRTPIDESADRHRHNEHDISWKVVAVIAAVIVLVALLVYAASGLLKRDDKVLPQPTDPSTTTSATATPLPTATQEDLVPFTFSVKAKAGKASDVQITVDGDEAYNDTLIGGEKKEYIDITTAELRIKKPKNITVTQNGTNIPIPSDGKLTLTAHATED